jgi:hypothetical protein
MSSSSSTVTLAFPCWNEPGLVAEQAMVSPRVFSQLIVPQMLKNALKLLKSSV